MSPLLQVSYIEAIACTRNGDVWIGANKGIFRRKAGSQNFELCDPRIQKSQQPYYDVKSIIEDQNGQIWIGTWAQGLLRYDPQSDRYYTYKDINPSQSAHILFQDSHQDLWIGTWRHGLAKIVNPYDMDNYSFKYFTHDEKNPQSLCDNIVYTIAQDQNSGKLWIGSRSGLSILESQEGKGVFSNYLPGKDSNSLPFNEVDALMYSRDGLMWIGMLGGGVYTVNTRQKLFDYDPIHPLLKRFSANSVRSAYPAGEHSIYMGIMGYGLIEYNVQEQNITHYKQHKGFRHMPYISTVNDIIRLSDGRFCFATWDDGIWIYDGEKAYAINQKSHPTLTDVCIYSLLEDKCGNLWIGTRAGLCMLDVHGKMWSIDKLAGNEKTAWPQVPVFKIAEDSQHHIWQRPPTMASGNLRHKKTAIPEKYTTAITTILNQWDPCRSALTATTGFGQAPTEMVWTYMTKLQTALPQCSIPVLNRVTLYSLFLKMTTEPFGSPPMPRCIILMHQQQIIPAYTLIPWKKGCKTIYSTVTPASRAKTAPCFLEVRADLTVSTQLPLTTTAYPILLSLQILRFTILPYATSSKKNKKKFWMHRWTTPHT